MQSGSPSLGKRVLIALGIVFGDIGTSPLYVLDALLRGKPIDSVLVLGGLSLIFWTLTLFVTIKYALLVMRADNRGEGGIFALYVLLRRFAPWIGPLVIAGAAMTLADSIFTPAISVTSAIEGLVLHFPGLPTVPIVVAILVGLFLIQQFGTEWVGKAFGPIMLLWFAFLGVAGGWRVFETPEVLAALNPQYALDLFRLHPKEGFLALGMVFLSITGVEALYADMGHVGRLPVRLAWTLVKPALLLNYFGQGAWVLAHRNGLVLSEAEKPFFLILPDYWLFVGVGIATLATVIASQSLITSAFTIFSEASRLGVWPRLEVRYPARTRSQMYVPFINWLLLAFVILIVVTMRRSSAMEAAYGLSINIVLLVTTILVSLFFWFRVPQWRGLAFLLPVVYLPTESIFLASNFQKFVEGGWIALALGGGIALLMALWQWGEKVKKQFSDAVDIGPYIERLQDLSQEEHLPYFATHLVCLTTSPQPQKIEHRLVYVLINRQPKRARTYWFVHVAVSEDPYEATYRVHPYVPGTVYRVDFYVGFKLQPRLNLLLRQVVQHLVQKGEIDLLSPYPALRKYHQPGDFRFLFVRRIINFDTRFSPRERLALQIYQLLDKLSLPVEKAYGLDAVALTMEQVPLTTPQVPPELTLSPRA